MNHSNIRVFIEMTFKYNRVVFSDEMLLLA
jgi:hypothetical protein